MTSRLGDVNKWDKIRSTGIQKKNAYFKIKQFSLVLDYGNTKSTKSLAKVENGLCLGTECNHKVHNRIGNSCESKKKPSLTR